MYAWEAIQNSLNTIEENLSAELKIETLADAVALSPYYFQRLFGRLVKKPVNEYIKLRRLAKASQILINSDNRILDIALECGFSSHASFTRVFTEVFGITPEEYRDCPVILNQFVKPDLKLIRARIEENEPLIADGMVVEVARRNLDKPRIFIGFEHEIPVTELVEGQTNGVAVVGEMWQEFHLQKSNIPNLLKNGNELGVLTMGSAREGCCIYMTGAETVGNSIAEGYSSFSLPSGEYIVCGIEAENFTELVGSAVFKATAFMGNWMKQHNLVCGKFAAEMYYDIDPDASYMELWLPLNPTVGSKRENIETVWDKNNGTRRPSLEKIDAYVNNPLWEQLREHLEMKYQSSPILEFSKCSAQHGWNVKYKKGGRTLCTLYPIAGHFIVLVVIGQREKMEFEAKLPSLSEYLQKLYHETESGMGQKWLMVDVRDADVLEDVKQCISIRRGKGKTNFGGNEYGSRIEN